MIHLQIHLRYLIARKKLAFLKDIYQNLYNILALLYVMSRLYSDIYIHIYIYIGNRIDVCRGGRERVDNRAIGANKKREYQFPCWPD